MEEVAFQESLQYDDGKQGSKNMQQQGYQINAPIDLQFRKKHQEYIAQRKARKQQQMRMKKIQFGQSSSDDDQFSQSQKSESNKPSMIKNQPPPQVTISKEVKVVSPSKNDGYDTQKYSLSIKIKKNSQWINDVILFNKANLVLPNYSYYYKDISKLKIFNETVLNDHMKIKVSYQTSQEFYLGASPKVLVKNLPMHYYIFAKILSQKLYTMGLELKQPNIQQIPGVPQAITVNSSIYGKILKKSQMLGKWEERFIVINKQGIYSYKKFNEKYSMFIPNGQIKQIWTRFEIIEGMLIVKMEYNSTKTQFGIPITNYLSLNAKHNWLWQFYKKSVKV